MTHHVARLFVLSLLAFISHGSFSHADDASQERLRKFLNEAKLADGLALYEKQVAVEPNNQEAKAALGLLRFMYAIEGLAQDYYRYGLHNRRIRAPGIVQMPLPTNPKPEAIDYKAARQVFVKFADRLALANETLNSYKSSDLKITLDVSKVFLDIDLDGKQQSYECFLGVLASVTSMRLGGNGGNRDVLPSITFAFDDADISWMHGYVHLLSAFTEVILAHDWQDAFERTGHLFFDRPINSYAFLLDERKADSPWNFAEIVDIIAFIHLIRFEVVEPERMKTALDHLEHVIRLSRETWRRIRLETDNDREWLPGPTQTSIISGGVGGQLGENWEKVLDQAQAILEGRELLPFWRGISDADSSNWGLNRFHPTLGINFRKIFLEPRRFEFVIWIQGTGMQPFLEEGKIANPNAWRELNNSFGSNLPFFAFWIN